MVDFDPGKGSVILQIAIASVFAGLLALKLWRRSKARRSLPADARWLLDPRKRQILYGCALALLVLVASIAVLEGGLRLASGTSRNLRTLLYSPTSRTQFDRVASTRALLEVGGRTFAPGQVWGDFVTNSRGFRTPCYVLEKPPGTYRIVVLGDSFTYGARHVPYHDLWPTQLERLLQARSARDVELINLGVPGVGPLFELRLWELEGRRLEPDLVVLGFYVGNDFFGESGVPIERTADALLAQHSRVYRLVRNLLRLWREHAYVVSDEPAGQAATDGRVGVEVPGPLGLDPEAPSMSEERFMQVLNNHLQRVRVDRREALDRRAKAVKAVLERLSRSVWRAGADLLIVVMPDELQVDRGLLDATVEQLGIAPEIIDLDYHQRLVRAICDELELPCIDLLSAFRAAGRTRRLHLVRDTHWNAEGNILAARTIAAQLPLDQLESLARIGLAAIPVRAGGD